jgi:hypothetical protein
VVFTIVENFDRSAVDTETRLEVVELLWQLGDLLARNENGFSLLQKVVLLLRRYADNPELRNSAMHVFGHLMQHAVPRFGLGPWSALLADTFHPAAFAALQKDAL